MGGKTESDFTVEHWRKGIPGFEIIATVKNLTIARYTFWASVEVKGGGLFAGDQILLRHGARVILQYPPDVPKAQFRP